VDHSRYFWTLPLYTDNTVFPNFIFLVFVGKLGNAIAFAVSFNYVAECYPTHLRGFAVGLGSSAARIGGLIAPQIVLLKYTSPILPSLVIASVSFITAVVW